MVRPITKEISNRFANMSIVCAFLVVIIHCRPHFNSWGAAWWVQQMLENGICLMAVPFFFLASGYFIAGHFDEQGWYRSALVTRIRTLLVPYLIWCTLFLIFLLCRGEQGDILTLKGFCRAYGANPRWFPCLTPLWYVRGLLVLVLLSPLLRRIAYLGWPALICVFAVYGVVCPGPFGDGWLHGLTRCGVLTLAGIFYFTLGMAIRSGSVEVNATIKKSVCAIVIGVSLDVAQVLVGGQHFGWFAIPFLIYGFWGAMPTLALPRWLTSCAFPVYLIHKFIYPVVHDVAGAEGNVGEYFISFIIVFSLSVVLAIIFRKTLPRISTILFGGR